MSTMPQVTGRYIRYNTDNTVKSDDAFTIDIDVNDRVRFADNSFLKECRNNDDGKSIYWMYFACEANGWQQTYGTVLRTNSCQTSEESHDGIFGKREVEMPIVVLADNGHIVYCNPVNIRKLKQ